MISLAHRIAPLAAATLVAPLLVTGAVPSHDGPPLEPITHTVEDCLPEGDPPGVPEGCDSDAIVDEIEDQLPTTTVPPTTTTSIPTDEAEKPVLTIDDKVQLPPEGPEEDADDEVTLTFELTVDDTLDELEEELVVPYEVIRILPPRGVVPPREQDSVTISPGGEPPPIQVTVDLSEGEPASPAHALVVELFPVEAGGGPGSNDPEEVVVAKRHGVGAVVEEPGVDGAVPRHVVVTDAVGARAGPPEPSPAEFTAVAVPPPTEGQITVAYEDVDRSPELGQPATAGTDYELPDDLTVDLTPLEPVGTLSVEVLPRQDAEPLRGFVLEATAQDESDDSVSVLPRATVTGHVLTAPAGNEVDDALACVAWISGDRTDADACPEEVRDTVTAAEDTLGDVQACAGWITGERTDENADACPDEVRDTVTAAEETLDTTQACVDGLTGEASTEDCPEEVGMLLSMLRTLLFSVQEIAGELPEVSIEPSVEVLEPPVTDEGDDPGTVSVEVTADGPRLVDTDVEWQAENASAEAGEHYGTEGDPTPPSGTLTFGAGTEPETREIQIPLIGNDESQSEDGDLQFTVGLDEGDGYTLGEDEAEVTIVDDDTIAVSIEEPEDPFAEPVGDGETETIELEVELTPKQHSRTVTVDVVATAGTFDRFELETASLTFARDDDLDTDTVETATQSVEVELEGDGVFKDGAERSFTVALEGPSDPPAEITVDPAAAEVGVADDDEPPEIDLAVSSQSSGEVVLEVTRTLPETTGETAVDTTFDYETVPGSALAGDDYEHTEDSTTIHADAENDQGERSPVSTEITVPVSPTGTGTFELVLSSLEGGVFAGDESTTLSEQVTLEPRRGHVLGLAQDDEGADELVSFDPSAPTATTPLGPIEGVAAGDELLAIEFDGDGTLHALARDTDDATPRLYELEYSYDGGGPRVSAERADLLPCLAEGVDEVCLDDLLPAPELTGEAFDLAWVPSEGDRVFRVSGDDGQHLRIDLDAMARIAPDLPFRHEDDPAGAAPALAGISYAPSIPDDHPLLFAVDIAERTLVHEPGELEAPEPPEPPVDVPPEDVPSPAAPANHDDPTEDPASAPDLLSRGAVVEVGSLGIPTATSGHGSHVGFDVGPDGVGYLTAFDGTNRTKLYTFQPVTDPEEFGGAEVVDFVGKAGTMIRDLAVEPTGLVRFAQSNGDSITEPNGDEGRPLSLVVERHHGDTGHLTVPYAVVSGGSATEGTDFTIVDDDRTVAFEDGEDAQTIDLEILANDAWQGDREFSLELLQPEGAAGLGDPREWDVTIEESDPGTVSIESLDEDGLLVVDEGDSDDLTIERSGGSEGRLLVDVATVELDEPDGEGREPATEDSDYRDVHETLSWDAGEDGARSVGLETIVDDEVEGDEIVGIALTNARLIDEDGTEIPDDDLEHELVDADNGEGTLVIREVEAGQVQFSTEALSVDEAEGADVEVTVVRTGGGSGEIEVEWQAEDGSAQAGEHYGIEDDDTPPSGTLTFEHGGESQASFTIDVIDNDELDGERAFSVELDILSYTEEHAGTTPDDPSDLLGEPAEVEVTIVDEDLDKTGGIFALETDDESTSTIEVEVREDAEVLELPVVRTEAGSGTVDVDWSAQDGTAEAGTDYGKAGDTGLVEGTVTFESKQLEETVAVPILDDEEVEGSRTFTVALDGASFDGDPDVEPEIVEPSNAEVTILDIEGGRAYGVGDGNELAAFNPVLPEREDDPAEEFGAIAGLDSDERVEGVVFGPGGEGLQVLTVEDVEGQDGLQQGRLHTVSFDEGGEPTADPLSSVFSLAAADALALTVDADGNTLVATTEGELVVVAPDGGHEEPTSLRYADNNETPRVGALATAPNGTVYGIDVEADALVRLGGDGAEPSPTEGEVTTVAALDIPVGDSPAALTIADGGLAYALVDSDGDDDEEIRRVFVEDTEEEGKSAGTTRLLTSLDNGVAGASSFTSLAVVTAGVLDLEAPATVTESEGELTLEVVRTRGTFGEVGTSYEVVDGSGDVVDSGAVTLDHGETEATVTHAWEPIEAYDDDRQVTARLLDPVGGAVLGDGTEATVTIENDNPLPSVSAGRDVHVVERGDGALARVRLHLSGATNTAAQVTARTVDASARGGRDYMPIQETVTFPAGATTRIVDVDIRALDRESPDRRFRVVLSGPVDATIGDSTATITIARDYPPPDPEPEVKGITIEAAPPQGSVTPTGRGYWIPSPVGRVFAFGDAEPIEGIAGLLSVAFNPDRLVVGLASDQSGEGVWLADRSGGVYSLGSARFHGSIPSVRAQGVHVGSAPVVDIAATPSGNGYVLLDEDGGIHTFGDAGFHGSVPQVRASGVHVGMARATSIAVTPSGNGYVMLDEDGGVHTFGDARFHGSIPGLERAGIPVGDTRFVSIALAPGGQGYWIMDEDGGIFTFGQARFHGSIPQVRASGIRVGLSDALEIEATATGGGYWIFDDKGGVFTFGDATFHGSVPGLGRG